MKNHRNGVAALASVLLLAACGTTHDSRTAVATPLPSATLHWVASWGTARQVPEPQNELAPHLWRDTTLRQIVHTSLDAEVLRVRISNAFGTEPLFVDGAGIALARAAGDATLVPESARPLTFDGRATVMIPAGGEYHSDPVTLAHRAGADLAVSLYFKAPPARQTGHPGARATSFIAQGNRIADAAWDKPEKVERWYALADFEVQAPRARSSRWATPSRTATAPPWTPTTAGPTCWPRSCAVMAVTSASSMPASAAGACCATASVPIWCRALSATCWVGRAYRMPSS